jgi:hypothetical protein
VPDTPPWGQNPGSSSSTTTSPRTGLWDLGGLDPDTPIIIQRGTGMSAGDRRHLGIGDQITAEQSATPPVAALPRPITDKDPAGILGDLVKRPITLFASDPKGYLQFQQALFAAGFYGATPASSIPWGSDPQGTTYDAWKKVLIAAQQAQSAGLQVTPDELLLDAAKRHQAATAGASVPKPGLVIQYSDPAVLRGLVQQAAQASLGRNLSAAQVNTFVNEFHAQEAAYSKKLYSAQQDTSGQQFELTQPNPSAQAQEFVDQGNPSEEGGQLLASYVGRLQAMLNGG